VAKIRQLPLVRAGPLRCLFRTHSELLNGRTEKVMARTRGNAALDTITSRRRLARCAAPHWRSVRLGLRIGWRCPPGAAAGTWLSRIALPGNDIRQKVLGGADDRHAWLRTLSN